MNAPPRHLLLLGAGHAHLPVLERLARLPAAKRARFKVTVVAPSRQLILSPLLPGFVAGHRSLADCTLSLERLIDDANVEFITGRVLAVDADHRSVRVQGPQGALDLPYDVLSIATGTVMDRTRAEQRMPGAREHALFLRPLDAFAAQWDTLCQRGLTRPLRLAVVGGGAGGVEMALAVQHRLPTATVSLVVGTQGLGQDLPPALRTRAQRALRDAGVDTVALTCTGIGPDHLRCADGSQWPCDAALLVTGPEPTPWLARSSLARDGDGFLAINPAHQSLSHPAVFSAGDLAGRADLHLPKSAAQALRAGQALARNLLLALDGKPLKPHHPGHRTVRWLDAGDATALLQWGPFSAQGAWVWRRKYRAEQKFLRRFGTPL